MAKAKKTVKKTAKKPAAKKAAKKPAAKKARKTAKKPATKKAAKKPAAKKAVKKPAAKKAAKKSATKKTAKKAVKKAVKPAATKARKPAAKKTVKPAAKPAPKAKKTARIKLSAKEKRDYKAMLLGMRQQLSGQISSLKRDSLQRNDSVVSDEDGTDAFERQFALKIASSEQNSLFDIDDALRRLAQGTYGICEECACTVETPRLKALPFVRLCIKCQSETEKGRAKFRP
jgi:RNA polymerase-binding protein DksA